MQPFQYFQIVNLSDCLSSWYKAFVQCCQGKHALASSLTYCQLTYHKFLSGGGVHGIVFKAIKIITKQVRRYFIVYSVL